MKITLKIKTKFYLMHAVKFTNNSSDAITPCLVTDLLCIALKDKPSLQYEPGLFIAFSMTLMLEGQLDQQGFFYHKVVEKSVFGT